MTESSHKADAPGDFDDEEDEADAHNNFLTQADLFKSYAEQNKLYCNLSDKAMWFEFGGRNIGRMSLDMAAMHRARQNEGQGNEYSVDQDGNMVPKSNYSFKWRRCGRYRENFSSYFTMVFVSLEEGIYLIGGNGNPHNNLHYNNVTIKIKKNLP